MTGIATCLTEHYQNPGLKQNKIRLNFGLNLLSAQTIS